MKIVSNNKLIQRNKKIGQITTIGSLVILGIGLYFSFAHPEQIQITFGALLVGFIMTQIGSYYSNRWTKSPRPDEIIGKSLKGLEEKYTLYHYVSGISHMLVGPIGLLALVPISVPGTISYDEKRKRFKQAGGNAFMKIFGQESIGRPELDARYSIEDIEKYLNKNFSEIEFPEPTAIIVFTNPKATLGDLSESPYPAIAVDKLKDYIRKKGKEHPIPQDTVQIVQKSLPSEDLD
jgi:hypothetical protein